MSNDEPSPFVCMGLIIPKSGFLIAASKYGIKRSGRQLRYFPKSSISEVFKSKSG